MQRPVAAAATAAENAVITKATLRAADLLDITARTLSLVIGVSEATVSRMRKQEFLLERGTKPCGRAGLVVRRFRARAAHGGGVAPGAPAPSRSSSRCCSSGCSARSTPSSAVTRPSPGRG